MAQPIATETAASIPAGGGRMIQGAFALLTFIAPPLAIFAPLAMTPLLTIMALVILAFGRRNIIASVRTFAPLAILLAGLCGWGMVSTLWSIIPSHSIAEGLRVLGINLCGIIVLGAALRFSPGASCRIGLALLAGVVLTLIVLAIERFDGTPLMRFWHPIPDHAQHDLVLVYFRFDRGVTVLVLMLWAALYVPVARGLRFALLIAAAMMTSLMISETAMIALGAGLFVLIVAQFFPRSIAVLMMVGLATLSIAIPLATPSYQSIAALHTELPSIKWSGIHRLLIWRFASDRVAERPVLGWGMDASRAVPGGDTDLVTLLPPGPYPAQAQALPLHPHNGALQLLLELGIPGLLLGLGIVGWIIVYVAWRAPLLPSGRAGALALITSCLTVGLLSFGIWQEWWQATIWLAASAFSTTATLASRTRSLPKNGI